MTLVEPIDEIMDAVGEELTFLSFSIKGIPGFSLSALYSGETSVYTVEKTEFSFMVKTSDCATNSISDAMSFTYSDTTYTHTFLIEGKPKDDLTGWSKLHVIWKGKIDV